MTAATKNAPDQSCNSVEGQDRNTYEENQTMRNATPSLARPSDTGPAIVEKRATETVLVPGWHAARWRTASEGALYRLIWCEEPFNDWHSDQYDAMPLDAWSHLSAEARDAMTTRGYQWGDDPTAPAFDGQYRVTYLGLYELVATGGDRWDRTAFGVFRRADAARL